MNLSWRTRFILQNQPFLYSSVQTLSGTQVKTQDKKNMTLNVKEAQRAIVGNMPLGGMLLYELIFEAFFS